jgi:CRISPR-associated endonuclease/helicase Cas3
MAETFYAHSTPDPDRQTWQALREHLESVAKLAAESASKFGAAEWGRICGLLHDLGKYSPPFQRRLAGGSRVDHATAGAVEAQRLYRDASRPIQFVVAGHHAGLANGDAATGGRRSTLRDRLAIDVDPYGGWSREITLPERLPPPALRFDRAYSAFQAAFFTRMLFSCLVDADYRDTAAFYDRVEGRDEAASTSPSLAELADRLDRHLATLPVLDTPVNRLRAEILAACRAAAAAPQGTFSLTVPTGGGKTLSSLAFALGHARRHGLDRVIYVIPFTSIVEQTAAVFRTALGDDAVLEHHSAFEEAPGAEPEAQRKLRLVMESWDAPVIVTTAVQFFESLFADRPSRCRKLHNVARSVVVLDEAQTLPLPLLRPCVAALAELACNYRTSIVLCTATQPAIVERPETPERSFKGGLRGVCEIAPEPEQLYRQLKRVTVTNLGELDDAALAERVRGHEQALCIVDTRAHARELHERLGSEKGVFHLSALMCAKHRSARLKEIRERLNPARPQRCVVVSTSLIEAGVDVDFPVVYRALAGLDSLVQAAGRCNREGRREHGQVLVFRPQGRVLAGERNRRVAVASEVMAQHEDPLSLSAVEAFFRGLYWHEGEKLDAKGIMGQIAERIDLLFPFEQIARDFRMIESGMMPVIVPFDGRAEALIRELRGTPTVGGTARALQPYVVQLPPKALAALIVAGAVEEIAPPESEQRFHALAVRSLYRSDVGLTWDDPAWPVEEMIIDVSGSSGRLEDLDTALRNFH